MAHSSSKDGEQGGASRKPVVVPRANRQVLNDHLTRDELAADFAVSGSTLERWESEKSGPLCFRIGTIVWYPIADVQAWLAVKANAARVARERHAQ